jgi:pyruvate,water dikinase
MRGGVTELLPDPVSVLFETLGLPAFERAIKEYQQGAGMGPAMQDWGFVTINGYVYAWVRVSARMLLEVLRALPRLLGRAAQAPMAPEDGGLEQRAPEAWGETLQAYRRQVAALQGQPAGLAAQALLERMEALALACGRYWAVFAAIVPYLDRAEGRFTSLYRRLRRRDDPGPVALLRGLENRPLEAERALYRAGEGDLDAYVAEYGHAVYNLDFAVPLAGEERAALEAMRRASASLWREGAPSPDERHRRLAEEQEEAAERIRKRLAAPLLLPGCLRRLFDRALVAAQQAARVREDALFDLGLAWVPLRQYALALGRRLVEAGALAQPGHVFWLRRDELAALAESLDRQAEQETRFLAENGFLEEPISSLAGQAEARQREREAVRGVRVPFTVPERKVRGLASLFVPTAEARRQLEGDVLTGTGTSPGQVTGVARVVRGPQEFGRLGRGEILVAHATTPAWTPLFALAGGLVADLGGALSHGSVIAREYGIPAVMGTGNGTERVQDGQVVIVDGTAGKVYLKT